MEKTNKFTAAYRTEQLSDSLMGVKETYPYSVSSEEAFKQQEEIDKAMLKQRKNEH